MELLFLFGHFLAPNISLSRRRIQMISKANVNNRNRARTVGFLCSTRVKKIENAQEGKNSKSSLVKSLQTMGKVNTVHLFPCRLYKKRQFISILVKNPPKLKLLFLVMLSNLDFRVSNERSGPHEYVIKNI